MRVVQMFLRFACLVLCATAVAAAPKIVLEHEGKPVTITWDGTELKVPQHCDQRCINHFTKRCDSLGSGVAANADALNKGLADVRMRLELTEGLLSMALQRLDALDSKHNDDMDRLQQGRAADAAALAQAQADSTAADAALARAMAKLAAMQDATNQRITSLHTTPSPTSAPTAAPTPAPTPHPCDSDSHGCDTNTGGICYKLADDGFLCGCKQGYSEISPNDPPYNAHKCAPTTSSPTNAPTPPLIDPNCGWGQVCRGPRALEGGRSSACACRGSCSYSCQSGCGNYKCFF
jgi:hypothetical protein